MRDPWRDETTAWCWSSLEHELASDAHSFGEVLGLLDAVGDHPDRVGEGAERLPPALAAYGRLG